jgi:hypothetical protein
VRPPTGTTEEVLTRERKRLRDRNVAEANGAERRMRIAAKALRRVDGRELNTDLSEDGITVLRHFCEKSF